MLFGGLGIFFWMNNKITPKEIFLSSASGILLTLAFPNFYFSQLAWVSFIPLFIALEKKPPPKAFFLGWLTGLIHFMTLLHWVTVSITHYGNLPKEISILLLWLISLYLGLYVGCFSGLISFFRSRYLDDPVVISPIIWVILEYLRTYLLSGFPWGLLGYSQYQHLSLIQISDITGVYGVSFIIVMLNVFLYLLIKWTLFRRDPFPFRYALLTLITFLVVIFYGSFRIKDIENLTKKSPSLKVDLIQGNIEQNQKWEPSYINETLHIYQGLTIEAAQNFSDLIVWPESAVPCYFTPELKYSSFFLNLLGKIKAPILFGSLAYEPRKDIPHEFKYFNSAFLSSSGEKVFPRYDKIHLVPFGEYVPLKPLLPFVEKLVVGIGDFSPGDQFILFSIPQAKFGVLICYEIIFPDLSRSYSKSGAGFLVNITNDAWFGRTSAPYQHFSMAVFRAIENRTALVRAANSGISGIIEPTGYIQAQTPIFIRTFLEGKIPVKSQPTFYSQNGDVGVAFCGIIFLVLIIFGILMKQKDK